MPLHHARRRPATTNMPACGAFLMTHWLFSNLQNRKTPGLRDPRRKCCQEAMKNIPCLASIASDLYRIGAHTAAPLCTSDGITDSTTAAWVPTEHRNAALNFRRMFPLPHDAPPILYFFPKHTQLFPALVASPFPPLLVQSSCELVPANPYPSRYPPLPVLKYTPSGRYPRPLSSVRHNMLDAGHLHAGCG